MGTLQMPQIMQIPVQNGSTHQHYRILGQGLPMPRVVVSPPVMPPQPTLPIRPNRGPKNGSENGNDVPWKQADRERLLKTMTTLPNLKAMYVGVQRVGGR